MVSQKTKKQQQLQWRRQSVLTLLAEDHSQNEIASILKVSPASISKDVAYLKDQSRLLLRTHLKENFPLEYQQALINLKSIRREAREMLRNPETDDRIKSRLFIVIKDITESIMNLVLKGDVIDDAITFMEDKTAEVMEHMTIGKREQHNNNNNKMSKTKQSFERRLKRKGIELRSSQLSDKSSKLDRFKGLEFWIWDKAEHERRFNEWIQRGLRPCCFNHAVGLPRKGDVAKPLFDYEKEIYDALQQTKYIWIKKATGLGITEFMLRYTAWLCLRDDMLKGSYVGIVTGPRIELAITLINRLKSLFSNIKFDDKETVCTLNDVRIEAFPSHHLDSMRGLDKVSFILLDEADFFPLGQQQEARAISERYIAKSNPYIVMVSTPNRPEGLFEQIEREPAGKCLYHRIFLPYHVGLGKIYTEEEIAKARESPQFPREYDLQYIGQEGNVFSHESIERAIQSGLEVNKEYPIDEIPQDTNKSMGIDAGFGSSKFAIVVTQLLKKEGKIQVLYAEEFERPDFGTMVEKIVKMNRNYTVSKIYIDNANPEVITAIKAGLSERTDYDRQITHWKSVNRYYKPETYMKVIPVSFSSNGREMLAHTKYCLDNSWLAIHSNFSKLVIALRTAVASDGLLDKQSTAHDDILDAFRLSISFYK